MRVSGTDLPGERETLARGGGEVCEVAPHRFRPEENTVRHLHLRTRRLGFVRELEPFFQSTPGFVPDWCCTRVKTKPISVRCLLRPEIDPARELHLHENWSLSLRTGLVSYKTGFVPGQ